MQTSYLSPTELATIERSIAEYSQEFGMTILGSKLGLIISKAIAPQTLRDLGGLKKITSTDLHRLVTVQPISFGESDVKFTITTTPSPTVVLDSLPFYSEQEIAGKDLWRFFSNPTIKCTLSVNERSKVFVGEPDRLPPAGYKVISRPDSEQYRQLAEQFADQQVDLAIKSFLRNAAADQPNFYTEWIRELRRQRTSSLNLLRDWESVKTEYVSGKLHSALLNSGVEEAQAAEIVALARPRYTSKSRAVNFPVVTPESEASKSILPGSDNYINLSVDIIEFRRVMHGVIDLMSLDELRAIKVSAGILHDAYRRSRE